MSVDAGFELVQVFTYWFRAWGVVGSFVAVWWYAGEAGVWVVRVVGGSLGVVSIVVSQSVSEYVGDVPFAHLFKFSFERSTTAP